MRLLHLIVIAALVSAAVYVYKIKFDSAKQAERVADLTTQLRKARDAVASLRADWSALDNPARVQGLAGRHLKLRPMEATQIDTLDRLPDRPEPVAPDDTHDPIGAMIVMQAPDYPTGGLRKPAR
jgi:hypothetical protein